MCCYRCRCQFLEEKHNKAISRDTWVQLLDFVRVSDPSTVASCHQHLVMHQLLQCEEALFAAVASMPPGDMRTAACMHKLPWSSHSVHNMPYPAMVLTTTCAAACRP